MQPLRTRKKIPRAWTRTEAACLLDMHPASLYRRIRRGEVRAFTVETFWHPPGAPHAFRRCRLFISTEALQDYMREREQQYAAGHGIRRGRPGGGFKEPTRRVLARPDEAAEKVRQD